MEPQKLPLYEVLLIAKSYHLDEIKRALKVGTGDPIIMNMPIFGEEGRQEKATLYSREIIPLRERHPDARLNMNKFDVFFLKYDEDNTADDYEGYILRVQTEIKGHPLILKSRIAKELYAAKKEVRIKTHIVCPPDSYLLR